MITELTLDEALKSPAVAKYFDTDLSPKKCPHCEGESFTEKATDTLDGYTVMESETVCNSCGETVACWAHGYYIPDYLVSFIGRYGVDNDSPTLDSQVGRSLSDLSLQV